MYVCIYMYKYVYIYIYGDKGQEHTLHVEVKMFEKNLTHMCPYTTTYVSSYYYICVIMVLYVSAY